MHRGSAVLSGWVDASDLPMEVVMQLKASSTFLAETLFMLFSFIQYTFTGKEARRAKRHRTLWNPIVNTSVATVHKRNMDEGFARCTSTTHLHEDYLVEDSAHVWVAM